MTRRRWIADTWDTQSASLTGDQATHLARVLRAEAGQVFDVVAGGFLHRASVTSVTLDQVEFQLHEQLQADAALPLRLYLAIFKFDHFEWAIEKATELGVSEIYPLLARRTEKHLAQAAVKRVERWRRIVHEAAQQSRRSDVPTIFDPMTPSAAQTLDTGTAKVLLSETEQLHTLAKSLAGTSDLALAIGPEGGWTADEMQSFHQAGWTAVTLGPRILRAETAAIAAIAIAGSILAGKL